MHANSALENKEGWGASRAGAQPIVRAATMLWGRVVFLGRAGGHKCGLGFVYTSSTSWGEGVAACAPPGEQGCLGGAACEAAEGAERKSWGRV